jgi:hypothetical protein
LSYNLIYNNENKDRNIFAPIVEESTSTLKTAPLSEEYYVLNSATTSPQTSIKVKLINESAVGVQVIKDTRFDVSGVTYYLDRAVNIKPVNKKATTTNTVKYKVIGFKGTANYEKFYAVDYVDENMSTAIATTTTDKNSPNNDILSLIPENFLSLKKSYVYDKKIDQTALVVIDKKDFEKVLIANSGLIQEYIKSFNTIFDLVEYEISINDYELELDPTTGLPVAFKNLNLEIIPKIKKDKVAATFKGFSKDTMRKIKNEIAKNITMNISYSPFWVNKVSDEDHISVEIK